jgi:hypothetical protein
LANNPFGFSKIYADKPNGEFYVLPANPNTDDRFDTDQEIIINNDGTFRFENDDDATFNILTSALFNEDNIVDDHGDLDIGNGGRGYMMDPKDWNQIEVDFEWKVADFSQTDGLEVTLGGGRHAKPTPFCEGCGYVVKFFYDGKIQILKEQWHDNKVPFPEEDYIVEMEPSADFIGNGTIQMFSRLVGFQMFTKFVLKKLPANDGNVIPVQIEVYHNFSGDKQTWTPLIKVLDQGRWGSEGAECNGARDQVINWAFPMVRFHWRNARRIDWYGINVREIQPNAPVPEDPDDNTGGGGTGGGGGGTGGGGGGGGGQPEIPPAEQPTGKVAKIASFRFSVAATLATSCDGTDPPSSPPQDPPNPPPDTNPPVGGGEFQVKLHEYFRVGSV